MVRASVAARFVKLRLLFFLLLFGVAAADVPVSVVPVTSPKGMVVAGHPQAAVIGRDVLAAGGNAVDAAVATSLALGVAEPYGSGLGGKLMLLYYEAASGRVYAVDAMDAAPASLDVEAYRKRPTRERSDGYGAAAVPGLAAGLQTAHARWGRRPWKENVAPVIDLARTGFEVLPKTRGLFEEKLDKLRGGDAEIARIFLPAGVLPEVGERLPNPDLARTLQRLADDPEHGFYRGAVAEAIASASARHQGIITAEDLKAYRARVTEPIAINFRGYRIVGGPPPASGASLGLLMLKILEPEDLGREGLRTAENLDRVGRAWRVSLPPVRRFTGDDPAAIEHFERLVMPSSIEAFRREAGLGVAEATGLAVTMRAISGLGDDESEHASTTHFVVVDAEGNIVCATQSLSLHFGAGVVPPGTGVVLNDSMSNFSYADAGNPNALAAGRRPRSTIAPTLVLRDGKPVLAIGIPGASRIPTAIVQVLLDRLVWDRPLAEAIGDTRIHYYDAYNQPGRPEFFETEESLPAEVVGGLEALGWKVRRVEPAGTGRHFGGINAVEINPDGTLTGYADPRRTNEAAGR